MANQKITQLTELTTPIKSDMLVIVDDPNGTPITKKIQAGNLFADGWVADGLTWTYASASTFTVSGDVTATYQKGTFLRWKQGGGWKYGVVASSSYAAPNTTVTIIVNTDYTIANAAITDPWYSYAANPQGWPGLFSYTPSWTAYSGAPTIGNGTISGRYQVSGGTVVCSIAVTFGSTTNFANSTTWYFSLPVNSVRTQIGLVIGQDETIYTKYLMQCRTETNKIVAGMINGTSNWVSYNLPYTWAAGHIYIAEITYEF